MPGSIDQSGQLRRPLRHGSSGRARKAPPGARPDFLIRLTNATILVLEVKGQDSPQNRAKRNFLDEWIQAVNQHGGFGRWAWAVSRLPADVAGILADVNRDAA